jgi:hypothetical protein
MLLAGQASHRRPRVTSNVSRPVGTAAVFVVRGARDPHRLPRPLSRGYAALLWLRWRGTGSAVASAHQRVPHRFGWLPRQLRRHRRAARPRAWRQCRVGKHVGRALSARCPAARFGYAQRCHPPRDPAGFWFVPAGSRSTPTLAGTAVPPFSAPANLALEARPNGKPPGPPSGPAYHPPGGPGASPLAPPQLYVRPLNCTHHCLHGQCTKESSSLV